MTVLRMPEGVTKAQVDCNEPLLIYPGEIEARRQRVVEYIDEGRVHTTVFAMFDIADLIDALPANGRAELEVVGQLTTSQYFYGEDSIRIISRRPKP